ncbi:PolC-type DNA polymerase III N-terminal domain-containing protein [Lactococcus fujiensis]|uniref:PolC-type DNA polymerase III N-terminal domain-containing protein n=1 Tax=Lactococcus fujiensis TaxID=610251 RepID=UPI000AB1D941
MENLFEKLMDQIKLPREWREQALFQTAEIEEVQVHTERKFWVFQLHFSEILPVNAYRLLSELTSASFATIARTEIKVKVKETHLEEQLLNDYFQYILTLPEFSETSFASIFKKISYRIKWRTN